MRRLLWVFILLALIFAVAWLVSSPTKTTTSYHPVGLQLVSAKLSTKQQKICQHYPKRCLSKTTTSYKVKRSRDTACNGGPSFAMAGKVVGENRLIDDIVDGTAVFHACVDRANPTRFKDTWFTWNKHTSWLWAFQGMSVQANHTGWCAECYSQYHYWRLQFEWFHGFNVFGQEIGWHYTGRLTCTVRADPVPKGRWTCR